MSAEVKPGVSVTVRLAVDTTYDNPAEYPQQVYVGGHGSNNVLLYSTDPAAFRQLSAALLAAANRLDESAANERASADADDYLVIVDDREGVR